MFCPSLPGPRRRPQAGCRLVASRCTPRARDGCTARSGFHWRRLVKSHSAWVTCTLRAEAARALPTFHPTGGYTVTLPGSPAHRVQRRHAHFTPFTPLCMPSRQRRQQWLHQPRVRPHVRAVLAPFKPVYANYEHSQLKTAMLDCSCTLLRGEATPGAQTTSPNY